MRLDDRKILLVQPLGYTTESADRDISRKANTTPPLGLASIAAYLDRAGFNCRLLDCYAHSYTDSQLAQLLRDECPSLLGISCTASNFHDGVRLAELAKSVSPDLRVAFGGPHVSALQEQVFAYSSQIDYVVIGEGEQTLLELAQLAGETSDKVEGVVWRARDGSLVNNGYRRDLLVLDDLPFPAYNKLSGYPHVYKLPIFNYPSTPNSSCISSRGCPYSCSYCDRSVFQRTFRYNSADYLYHHLATLKERYGIRHVIFYDDQFTFHRGRIEEFCRRMIDKPLGITFNCAVRAEHVDRDLLRLMKEAGCWMMSLGIESGDAQLLSQHRQNTDLDRLAETIHTIKSCGIRTKGLLMMGLPGESEASIYQSMEYVFSLPIDDFNLAKFTPFPGSPIYEKIHELGRFDEDWPKMDCMHFQFIPQGMEKEQLEKLFINFYKTHFRRKRVLLGYLSMLWKSPDSWRRFAGSAGQFLRFAVSNKRYGSS